MVIVSIQSPTPGHGKDVYLRGTCKDMTLASVTEVVTAMLKDRDGHDLSKLHKRKDTFGRGTRKSAPVKRPDDERVEELRA